ncbi:MAG TPA: type II toxin-antitoxin system RelE/ParE family toxin [Xanthobacteraceae bacterium]|jgi:hypothetical protein|nr:type II toxin-antitoxin system RelE/ParE family toxin [Xanthobacteraceae bacterium]
MHTVIETPTFLRDVERLGISTTERAIIVGKLALDPTAGDLMPSTGGARKVRIAGRGKGKSGGYRIVTYYATDDIPVFLLAVISKGERTNLSKAEQNELRKELSGLADDYRASVRTRVAKIGRK